LEEQQTLFYYKVIKEILQTFDDFFQSKNRISHLKSIFLIFHLSNRKRKNYQKKFNFTGIQKMELFLS
jgi:hypothetical protein